MRRVRSVHVVVGAGPPLQPSRYTRIGKARGKDIYYEKGQVRAWGHWSWSATAK